MQEQEKESANKWERAAPARGDQQGIEPNQSRAPRDALALLQGLRLTSLTLAVPQQRVETGSPIGARDTKLACGEAASPRPMMQTARDGGRVWKAATM